jgi:cell wall-associated NlpC family hydrolase
MQFEPTTFATYDQPIPPGGADPPSPYDPTDAVYAAAKMLCADGAAGGTDITGALFAYNHSQAYVTEVLNLAQRYGQAPAPGAADPTGGTSQTGDIAAAWALGQVGIPYVWGGESPGVGFDCSGLAQAAYKAAVFTLPRVAQDQYDAGPLLAAGSPLEPGDLVFFGASSAAIDHVGLYVGTQDGQALMVDAPHTGADVRVEPFPTAIGAAFGDQLFVGATDPAG